jgi:hypothetical protein
MLERSVERSLQEMADQEQPHPKVSIQRAIKQGSARLRRRRLMLGAGTPVLAACAALAISLAGVAPWSGHSSPQAGSTGPVAPGTFNPAKLTIGFGWLPRGSLVQQGETTPAFEYLNVSASHGHGVGLAVYARNACRVSKANGIKRLACLPSAQNSVVNLGSTNTAPLAAGHPPAIDGHESFWLDGCCSVAWEHAPREWAVVSAFTPAVTIRIAKAVTFGQQGVPQYGQREPLLYGVRFTSIPPGWRLVRVDIGRAGLHGVAGRDVYEATDFTIAKVSRITATTQTYTNAPLISFSADHSANRCYFPTLPGRSPAATRHLTIHGYRFILASFQAGKLTYQTLCGSPIDGLAVTVMEQGAHQVFPPIDVMERLELLGPNPDHWVTNPLP